MGLRCMPMTFCRRVLAFATCTWFSQESLALPEARSGHTKDSRSRLNVDTAHERALAKTLFALSAQAGALPTRMAARASRAKHPRNQEGEDAETEPEPVFDVKEMAGVTAPLGFFDPLGFSTDATEGKIRFYREVELKHGRVGMLPALGFLVAENFHPLFGGNIDVPSYLAFQQTPLQTFWPAVVFAIAILETFSVFTFNSPFGGEPWSIRSDHEPGNLGFDPLGLKPTDPKELKEMQNKELNNGRLAMLAAAGMIAQEMVSGQKLPAPGF